MEARSRRNFRKARREEPPEFQEGETRVPVDFRELGPGSLGWEDQTLDARHLRSANGLFS